MGGGARGGRGRELGRIKEEEGRRTKKRRGRRRKMIRRKREIEEGRLKSGKL